MLSGAVAHLHKPFVLQLYHGGYSLSYGIGIWMYSNSRCIKKDSMILFRFTVLRLITTLGCCLAGKKHCWWLILSQSKAAQWKMTETHSVSLFLWEEARITLVLQENVVPDLLCCTECCFGAQPAHIGRAERPARKRRLQSRFCMKQKIRIRKGILWLHLENTWWALKSCFVQINNQHAWQFVAFLLSWRIYLVHAAWFISVGRKKCLFTCVLSSCIVMFWFWHVPLLWHILRYTLFVFPTQSYCLNTVHFHRTSKHQQPSCSALVPLCVPFLLCCYFSPALPWICVFCELCGDRTSRAPVCCPLRPQISCCTIIAHPASVLVLPQCRSLSRPSLDKPSLGLVKIILMPALSFTAFICSFKECALKNSQCSSEVTVND